MPLTETYDHIFEAPRSIAGKPYQADSKDEGSIRGETREGFPSCEQHPTSVQAYSAGRWDEREPQGLKW